MKEVVWYCGLFTSPQLRAAKHDADWELGSSKGRGTRAASWFADYIEQQGETQLRSLVLDGGIKGWAASGQEYTDLMDEYDASVWAK